MPKLPKGVKNGIMADLAAKKPGAPGLPAIADHWGVSMEAVLALQKNKRAEIADMRGAISETGFMLAGQAMTEISKKLSSPAVMAETPLRDLAMTQEKLVNAAVTAADGHKPQVQINFGELVERKAKQDERDRQLRAMKEARGRVVA